MYIECYEMYCYSVGYTLYNIQGVFFLIIAATSTVGFEGCLFRAQFDNQFPIKRVFQDPVPDNIILTPEGRTQINA